MIFDSLYEINKCIIWSCKLLIEFEEGNEDVRVKKRVIRGRDN